VMPAFSSIAIGGLLLGEGVEAYGKVKANREQAKAEMENANFLREQAEFARQAMVRELEIFGAETEEFIGRQTTQAAASGIDVGGSALLLMADTRMKQMREESAIKEDSRMRMREAALKAGASEEQAKRLTNFWNNALPVAGGLLETGARIGLKK